MSSLHVLDTNDFNGDVMVTTLTLVFSLHHSQLHQRRHPGERVCWKSFQLVVLELADQFERKRRRPDKLPCTSGRVVFAL